MRWSGPASGAIADRTADQRLREQYVVSLMLSAAAFVYPPGPAISPRSSHTARAALKGYRRGGCMRRGAAGKIVSKPEALHMPMSAPWV